MKFILAFAVLSVFSLSALAQVPEPRGPRIEPGPVRALSADARVVSAILLNSQNKDCVTKWQKAPFDMSILSVAARNISPRKTEYRIAAMAIVQGDIAVGEAYLNISEERADGVFGNSVMVYKCNVVLPRN
ncbi:MAG TPA: hypothetical protein VNJ01_08020 [Bacteriovoracaceae bacterium]|nr:hypothetical protein [Bacteriovoracaceae bacterium]